MPAPTPLPVIRITSRNMNLLCNFLSIYFILIFSPGVWCKVLIRAILSRHTNTRCEEQHFLAKDLLLRILFNTLNLHHNITSNLKLDTLPDVPGNRIEHQLGKKSETIQWWYLRKYESNDSLLLPRHIVQVHATLLLQQWVLLLCVEFQIFCVGAGCVQDREMRQMLVIMKLPVTTTCHASC